VYTTENEKMTAKSSAKFRTTLEPNPLAMLTWKPKIDASQSRTSLMDLSLYSGMIAFSSSLLGAMGIRGIGRLSKLRIARIATFIYIYQTTKMLINESVQ